MAEGAGFSGRYANKPLPDVSGVRFGLKLLLVSAGIIVVGESLPAARRPPPRLDERKRFGLLLTVRFVGTRVLPSKEKERERKEEKERKKERDGEKKKKRERDKAGLIKGRK